VFYASNAGVALVILGALGAVGWLLSGRARARA
jgi:hypothetical protein